jgi:Siphovirus-type tail component, C-terminal domain
MPEALLDQDHEYDIDGVTVGRPDSDWPALISVAGMGVPELRLHEADRPQQHGMNLALVEYMTGRYIDMSIGREHIYGTAAAQDAVENLKRAMRPRSTGDEMVLRWRYQGEPTRRLKVRPRRCEFLWDELSYHGILVVNLQFLAYDPLTYSDGEGSISLNYVGGSGGLAIPHDFPHEFGTPAQGGTASAMNEGTMPTAPYGRIQAGAGGLTYWALSNDTNGGTFAMNLPMSAGEYLDFDFDRGTVLLSGTTSRSSYVMRPQSTWWKLEPGINSLNLDVQGVGTAEVRWRSAWV